MRTLPILFSGSMVRAILREIEQPGTGKTQTRRVITQPFMDGYYDGAVDCTFVPAPASNISPYFRFSASAVGGGAIRTEIRELRYQVGDSLWVREAHYLTDDGHRDQSVYAADTETVADHLRQMDDLERRYPTADWSRHRRLRPSLHMPRWASRLTLIVTDVRVQRLQDISRFDAMAEGIQQFGRFFAAEAQQDWDDAALDQREAFGALWESINASRGFGWDTNPWVVAITFRPHLINIDAYLERNPA